jgi:hypothetical protein
MLLVMREHTGIALAIAGAVVGFFTTLAAALVVLLWTALSIYAIVKWIGSAPDEPSATTLLLVVVGLVTGLTLVLAGTIAFIGRPMTPRRRKSGERDAAVDAVGM